MFTAFMVASKTVETVYLIASCLFQFVSKEDGEQNVRTVATTDVKASVIRNLERV